MPVQILDCWADPPQENGEAAPSEGEVEALLSRSLAHPYVVTTFDYAISKQVGSLGTWCSILFCFGSDQVGRMLLAECKLSLFAVLSYRWCGMVGRWLGGCVAAWWV